MLEAGESGTRDFENFAQLGSLVVQPKLDNPSICKIIAHHRSQRIQRTLVLESKCQSVRQSQ